MPVHDWTLVEAGIFHAFHTTWIGGIQNTLNEGLLPSGFYALAEQHAGRSIADVLTLHASPTEPLPLPLPPPSIVQLASDVLFKRPSIRVSHHCCSKGYRKRIFQHCWFGKELMPKR